MRNLLPLLLVFALGCGSGNSLLGEWVGVDKPGTSLKVTDREMIYRDKEKTETSRYKWDSPTQITVTPAGMDDVTMSFKVQLRGNSLTLAHENGTRTFRRK
jgi:hypothetical protein